MNNSENKLEDYRIRINDKYKYYNYIKKHKGQCLTIISFLAVILSFVSNALQYYSEVQLFKEWNIDSSFLKMPNDAGFLFGFTYCMAFTLVIIIITTKSVVCLKRFFTMKCELHLLLSMNSLSEQLHKNNEELYYAINTDNTVLDDEIRSEFENEKTVFYESKKRLRKQLWYYRVQLICDFLLFFITICGLLYVGNLYSTNTKSHTVVYAVMNTMIIFLSQYITAFFDYYRPMNNRIKEIFILSVDNPLVLETVFEDLDKNKKRLKKQRKTFLKFSDDEIKRAVGSFISTLFFLLVVFFVYTTNSNTNTFNIGETEHEQFVVVFYDGSDFFLKPISIEGDSIEVDLSETVITSERISIQRRKFESIKKLNKQGLYT